MKLCPLFDSLECFSFHAITNIEAWHAKDYGVDFEDYKIAYHYLLCYRGSLGTFNSYRREVEKIIQWVALIACKSLKQIDRHDIEDYINFCQNPPLSWIGTKKVPRFIFKDLSRIPNKEWRPFVVTVSKTAHRQGLRPQAKSFELSQAALKELFAILNAFFNYLVQEEYVPSNPVALIRQKSKFLRKHQAQPKIRRLSEVQWQYVMKTARDMSETHPEIHARTLFIMSALYTMYLRISELASSPRWSPAMNHFHRDNENHWWFTTVGKGNKQRQIAVSNAMLEALKEWRQYLKLSSLPSPADHSPLVPKIKGKGPITSTTYIREIVQNCFDQAISLLNHDNFTEEAEALTEATVHWLRHTGISDDIKHRPREHVRDDAGHSSSAITDKYIDIELKERHKSARLKRLV